MLYKNAINAKYTIAYDTRENECHFWKLFSYKLSASMNKKRISRFSCQNKSAHSIQNFACMQYINYLSITYFCLLDRHLICLSRMCVEAGSYGSNGISVPEIEVDEQSDEY
jgi:hypothetical protein